MALRRTLFLAGLGLLGGGLWRNHRLLIQRALNLPPPRVTEVRWSTIRLQMPDGTALATDVFVPATGAASPSILIRTPYGRPSSRSGFVAAFIARRFAERGYNVVYQDVRGRFGSEGEWEPYVHEMGDGAATATWILRQPWSDGQIGLWGQSYVGYTLWATACSELPNVRAIVPAITQSHLAERGAQGYQLDRTLRWLLLLDAMVNPELSTHERIGRAINARVQNRVVEKGFTHLPVETVDEAILGAPVPFYRKWVEAKDPSHPYWEPIDLRGKVGAVSAPAHLVGGWYDIFIEGQVNDYRTLHQAGHNPYLTIGPWTHLDFGGQWESIRLAMAWFDYHLRGESATIREKPVRLFVMGAEEWRDFDVFPPPAASQGFYLRATEMLAAEPPAGDETPERYRYDPAHPTPNLGGALLSSEAGAHDNRDLEARDDVMVYTSEVLTQDLDVIGRASATLWVSSTVGHTDFFVRITDVSSGGRSTNICDGHIRLSGIEPDQPLQVNIFLAPTAHRFRAGHRIRLQVSSGAHPRIGRNLGTDEAETRGTRMVAADQTVFHDPQRASHIVLPVVATL